MGKVRVIKLKNEIYMGYWERFRAYLSAAGYVPLSQRDRALNVMSFLEWADGAGLKEIVEVKPAHLREYHRCLVQRPRIFGHGELGEQGAFKEMYNIRLFFALLQQEGLIEKNPMSVLKFTLPPRNPKRKEVLTIAEIKEIYRACETLQEKALLSLLYGCGLRSMEVRDMNTDDLKAADRYIIIPLGKGCKRRTVPINGRILEDINNYMAYERVFYLKNSEQRAMMLNSRGERLQNYSINKMLSDIIYRTENKTIINKHIHAHHLRHSIATHLLQQGVPIEKVQQFLGHSHLETTEIYTRVSQKQLKAIL